MAVKKIRHKIPFITLIAACLVFLSGILMWLVPEALVEFVLLTAVIGVLSVYGFVRFVQALALKKPLEGIIALAVCWTIAALLFFLDYKLEAVAVFPSIMVGTVSLLLGVMRALICVNDVINHFRGAVRNGISAVFCLGFGVILLLHPVNNFVVLQLVVGFYLIFYACTMFGDAFASIFQMDLNAKRRRRRVHYARPNLLTAVKPSQLIAKINRDIKDGMLKSGVIVEEKSQERFDTVNLEVLIHLTTQGLNKFGHVDIAIGDTVYSYGTYDPSKVKYAGFVAQGCFIAVPKLPYLRYCLDVQKKYVVGFGACLSEEQLSTVSERIKSFVEDHCEPLESEYDRAVRENRDASALTDRLSVFARDIKGKSYTVVSGPYKRYFGININCVQFADWLLSDSGIDALSFSGIRTPGAYYAMMDNMFTRKNTRVFRKTYYILSDELTEEKA